MFSVNVLQNMDPVWGCLKMCLCVCMCVCLVCITSVGSEVDNPPDCWKWLYWSMLLSHKLLSTQYYTAELSVCLLVFTCSLHLNWGSRMGTVHNNVSAYVQSQKHDRRNKETCQIEAFGPLLMVKCNIRKRLNSVSKRLCRSLELHWYIVTFYLF